MTWLLARNAVIVCVGLLLALDAVVTSVGIPAGKIFAGHDSGFAPTYPHQFLEMALSPWDDRNSFGYPVFLAPLALPFAVLGEGIARLGIPMEYLSALAFLATIFCLQIGIFWLSCIFVRRAVPSASDGWVYFAALCAAIFASFNPYTAYLFSFPIISFQFGFALWPLTLAYEFHTLEARAPARRAFVLGALVLFALTGNPAHSGLGLLLMAAVALPYLHRRRLPWPFWATLTLIAIGGTAYEWLPLVGSKFLVHGHTIVREALKSGRDIVYNDQVREAARTSLSQLLRLGGVSSWVTLPAAGYYDMPLIVAAGAIPLLLAIAALLSRTRIVAFAWIGILFSIEMAKGVHGPLPMDVPWLFAHVPGYAAFRETYDKYIFVAEILLPPTAAVGIALAGSRWRLPRVVGTFCALAALVTAYPFIAGRVIDPRDLVTIPKDYQRLSTLLGGGSDARLLTLPGNYLDMYPTTWYLGMNFESFLFHMHVVNGALLKERGISGAPIYNDDANSFVADLPSVVRLMAVLDIRYIVLHKDFATEHDRNSRRALVNGPLFAAAAQPVLDADPALRKVFDGSDVVGYELKKAPSPAFLTDRIAPVVGYINQLVPLVEQGVGGASMPMLFFTGDQSNSALEKMDQIAWQRPYDIVPSFIPEPPHLYPEEMSVPPDIASAERSSLLSDRVPNVQIISEPRGNYITGNVPLTRNFGSQAFFSSTSHRSVRAVAWMRPTERNDVSERFSLYDNRGAEAQPIEAFRPVTELLASPAKTRSDINFPGSFRSVDGSQVTYVTNYKFDGTQLEGVRIPLSTTNVSLACQPRLTFMYQASEQSAERAYLRLYFSGPDAGNHWLDISLDNSGYVNALDIRSYLQGLLDQVGDQEWRDDWYSLSYRLRDSYFPAQADSYNLRGVALLLLKGDGEDARGGDANTFSIRYLDIRSLNPQHPSYLVSRGGYSFAPAGQSDGISDVAESRYQDAETLTAGVAPVSSIDAAIGTVADITLKNGNSVRGEVERAGDHVFVVHPTSGADGSVDLKQPLYIAQSDIQKVKGAPPEAHISRSLTFSRKPYITAAPYLAIPFYIGSANQSVIVRVQLQADRQTREYTYDSNNASGSVGASLTRDSIPAVTAYDDPQATAADSGWKSLTLNLDEVAASVGLPKNGTRLSAVSVEFRLPAYENPTRYVLGLANANLYTDVSSIDSVLLKDQSYITIDGRRLRATAVAWDASHTLATLDFGTPMISRGTHTFSTNLAAPLVMRSLGVFDAQVLRTRTASTQDLDMRKIGINLYSTSLDIRRPMYMQFAQGFDNGWRLYRVSSPPRNRLSWFMSGKWLHPSIGEEHHFVANGYANGWLLPDDSSGAYVVDFEPENLEIAGIILAVLALIGAASLAWFAPKGRDV
jgi:hypothetical protein